MTNHGTKLTSLLVLIAGTVLCWSSVAGAVAGAATGAATTQVQPQPERAPSAPRAKATAPQTPAVTAVQPVVLIPPLVIVPDPPAVVGEGGRSRSLVAPPASGPLLPNTGPTDTGVMALIGIGLIGLGWLVRWSAVR